MTASLQFTLSNPVPGREDAYNDWYGNDHLANGVLTPGVLAGQRFRRADGPWPQGRHDYMVIWEFDDPAYALEQLALVKGSETMPLSDAIDMAGIQPPTMWKRAQVRNGARLVSNTGHRGACVLMLANGDDDGDAFERNLLSGGLADLADYPGVLAADLLTLADEQIRGNARKYRYGVLIELANEAVALASLRDRLPGLPHLRPDGWLAPVYRPIGGRLTRADAACKTSETHA